MDYLIGRLSAFSSVFSVAFISKTSIQTEHNVNAPVSDGMGQNVHLGADWRSIYLDVSALRFCLSDKMQRTGLVNSVF